MKLMTVATSSVNVRPSTTTGGSSMSRQVWTRGMSAYFAYDSMSLPVPPAAHLRHGEDDLVEEEAGSAEEDLHRPPHHLALHEVGDATDRDRHADDLGDHVEDEAHHRLAEVVHRPEVL